MKKKKRFRKVGIALLVVCGLAAFANSSSDHNKTPANNTPSIASYSLSVDDSAAAPAFADVYASAGQTASSSNFRGSYSGDLKDGKRNGTGSFRWTSNVTYSGGWANDQMDGFGVLQFPEGYTLSGDFEAGKLKNGTIVYKSRGITWQQSVEQFQLNSQTTIIYADGTTVTERYADGYFNGQAQIQYANGDTYAGILVNSLKEDDAGTYTWADGAHFTGHWVQDKMEGQGIYYYDDSASPAQLSGTFSNNLPHGVLIYISKSGSVLRTQWENGVRVQ